ncbi:MAG: TonB-dependent receptor [Bacteroidetes bacterium]|nr:MAG: TonB-dependent receptor [Bacteroidota bacterium]
MIAQTEDITINGTVSDADNGETLIGATVTVPGTTLGTTTNEYGFYSLTIPRSDDSVRLDFSYVGFQTQSMTILPTKNITLNVELSTGIELKEVVVKADSYQEQLRSTQMSVEEISTKEVKVIPALLGETDILKTIQLKPGIPSGSEGTTGLFVRGGGSDQNLIILDEAVVYNANHLFGFFSTFNTDAIKDLKVYKGGFPAQYGGRLSSVIDVRMKEGNNRKFSGAGGLGLITSRLTLEGPIQSEKSSFIVSGRRTYVDIFTRQINKRNEDKEDYNPIPDYYFYDLSTKANYQLSEKDKLFISGYFGRDKFGFNGDFFDFNFDWGNATGTARWNRVFSPKLFSNTTFTYSDYQYNINTKITGFSFDVGSNIKDISLKSDLYYAPNNKHVLRFGGGLTYHRFDVGRLKAGSDDGEISFSAGIKLDGMEFGAYLGDEWTVNDALTINAGLRISGFHNDGAVYIRPEPRVSAKYALNDRLTLKGSYARMNQFVHLVSTSGIALPTDIWFPSTKRIKPQVSDQVALGWTWLLSDDLLLTNEFYYKNLQNQVGFVDWADLFANDKLEETFAIGEGYAYGMEIGLEKKFGKLKGWLGYTLALVKRGKFGTFNDQVFTTGPDGYYLPNHDRRHDFSIVAMYELNRRLTFSATVIYGSGDRAWLPVGRFVFQDVGGAPIEFVVPDYGNQRNNFRLPYFQRTDVAMVYKLFPKWGESDLTLSFFNVTNRRNTFFIYLEPEYATQQLPSGGEGDVPVGVRAKQVSLFPILGSLTWNFKF